MFFHDGHFSSTKEKQASAQADKKPDSAMSSSSVLQTHQQVHKTKVLPNPAS
jgi:hypothetical protein